jgi:hypothetical protein
MEPIFTHFVLPKSAMLAFGISALSTIFVLCFNGCFFVRYRRKIAIIMWSSGALVAQILLIHPTITFGKFVNKAQGNFDKFKDYDDYLPCLDTHTQWNYDELKKYVYWQLATPRPAAITLAVFEIISFPVFAGILVYYICLIIRQK